MTVIKRIVVHILCNSWLIVKRIDNVYPFKELLIGTNNYASTDRTNHKIKLQSSFCEDYRRKKVNGLKIYLNVQRYTLYIRVCRCFSRD